MSGLFSSTILMLIKIAFGPSSEAINLVLGTQRALNEYLLSELIKSLLGLLLAKRIYCNSLYSHEIHYIYVYVFYTSVILPGPSLSF
jgi:hypothetical protein